MTAANGPTLDELRSLLVLLAPDIGHLSVCAGDATSFVCRADRSGLVSRLGGHIAGPGLFQIMDMTAYLAVNWFAGLRPASVLTSADSDFLVGTVPRHLDVVATPANLGLRSAVVAVRVVDDEGECVATSTMRFALGRRLSAGTAVSELLAGDDSSVGSDTVPPG